MSMAFSLTLDGETHSVTVAERRPQLRLSVDGQVHTVSETAEQPGQSIDLCVDGRTYQVWRTWEGNRIHLRVNGQTFSVDYTDAVTAAQNLDAGDGVLRSEMPGIVVDVHCEVGKVVNLGDTLIVIESMKMQVNIVAPRDGRVVAIHVDANQTFEKGADLISLNAED
jgi:biotin carboxyl carrier protein